jgi:hypothetical protein
MFFCFDYLSCYARLVGGEDRTNVVYIAMKVVCGTTVMRGMASGDSF